MSVETDKLPPVPQHDPPIEERGELKRFTANWMRWFLQVKHKVDTINASLVNLGKLVSTGFTVKNTSGQWVTRTIEGTPEKILVTNGDGIAGNPVINLGPIIVQTITEDDTEHSPSGGTMFDALAGKADDAKLAVVAGLSANQVLANATTAKVLLDTESVDTDGCFDTATGVFTPTKAGLYLVIATISFPRVNAADPITPGKRLISYIYKNGASYVAITAGCNDSSTNIIQAIASVQMNGTTDYLEMYARRDTAIAYEIAAVGTQFSAIRIAA